MAAPLPPPPPAPPSLTGSSSFWFGDGSSGDGFRVVAADALSLAFGGVGFATGVVALLVALLDSPFIEAQKFSTGALWHLAASADNKTQMVTAGAIPLLVGVLESEDAAARESAAAVVSARVSASIAAAACATAWAMADEADASSSD